MKPDNFAFDAQKVLNWLTDRGAMFAAIIVSLGTVTMMFVVITPDILIFRIIMGSMGAILVLFSPRALAKNKKKLWLCIASLIVFSEVSTVLTMTDTQSHETTTTATIDPVLSHLQAATTTAQTNLTNLIDQQSKANTRATLDALADQIKTATAVYQESTKAEATYHGGSTGTSMGIDPNKLFMAIPTAIMSQQLSRWMTLVFSIIVAIVFQAVIMATVTTTVRQIKRDSTPKELTGKRKRKRPSRAIESKPVEPKPEIEVNFVKDEPSMMEVL